MVEVPTVQATSAEVVKELVRFQHRSPSPCWWIQGLKIDWVSAARKVDVLSERFGEDPSYVKFLSVC